MLMKRNVLMVTGRGRDGDPKTTGKEDTFDVLSLALEDIDLAIVDIGAGVQSLAIVETLSHREPAPPVIALVEGDDPKAMAALQQHGAAACLKKPFKSDELARLIQLVCASTSRDTAPSCDKWGHSRASK